MMIKHHYSLSFIQYLLLVLFSLYCSNLFALDFGFTKTVQGDFCDLPKVEFNKLSKESPEFLHVAKQKGQASVWESKTSGLVYIVDQVNQSLTIVDKYKDFVEEQPIAIPVEKGAIGVIANRHDTTAFVTNREKGTLSVIDVKARKLSATLMLKPGSRPFCQIFGKDEDKLYIVTWASEAVYVVDPNLGKVVNKMSVKDLSQESQLNYCYNSCHKDKRNVMLQSIYNKPASPELTLEVPETLLRHAGLRQNYQRIFEHITEKYPN